MSSCNGGTQSEQSDSRTELHDAFAINQLRKPAMRVTKQLDSGPRALHLQGRSTGRVLFISTSEACTQAQARNATQEKESDFSSQMSMPVEAAIE